MLATWLIKLSFCLSLQPLLRNGRFVYLLYAVGALVSIYSVFYFIWGMVNCIPFRAGPQHVICLSEQNMMIASYAHAGVLITTDIVLVISSVYVLWSLQMKTRTKISVAFFLTTGARCVFHVYWLYLPNNSPFNSPFVATIVRTVYMSQLYNIHENPSLGTDVGIWTIIELGFCVIATAGMTLRPLAVRLKLFTSQQQSDQPTGNDSTALNAPRRSHQRARDIYPLGPLLSQDDAIRVETITTVHYQAASSLSDISPSKYAKGWSSHYEC